MVDKQKILDRLPNSSDQELKNYAENARRQLPDAQWLIDAVAAEQLSRGGTKNITPDSLKKILVRCASEGKIIGYAELAEEFGLKWPAPRFAMMKVVGQMCDREEDNARPMLSSLIAQKDTGRCGQGFIELAKKYGRIFLDEKKFEAEERQRVFDYWQGKAR